MDVPQHYIDCQYTVGRVLELKRASQCLSVRILKIFRGDDVEIFSNSCTMLVQQESREIPGFPEKMVLKIFDWRYAHIIRTSNKKFEPWDSKTASAYVNIQLEERREFEDWLSQPLSKEESSQKFIQNLIGCRDLCFAPSHMDLFWCAMMVEQECPGLFLKKNLIPQDTTSVFREIFRSRLALHMLMAECRIADELHGVLDHEMPASVGAWSISYTLPTAAGLVNQEYDCFFEISGHLMEYLPGTPLHPGHLANCSKTVLRAFFRRLQLFHVKLWRCSLQWTDRNPNNILVTPQEDIVNFHMVDYGAITIVMPDEHDRGRIQGLFSQPRIQEPLHQQFYSTFFDNTSEADQMKLLFDRASISAIHAPRRDDLLTQCFSSELYDFTDRYAWHTITQHILHAGKYSSVSEQDTVIEKIYDWLCLARQIMTSCLQSSPQGRWWHNAFAEISRYMGCATNTTSVLLHDLELAGTFRHNWMDHALPLVVAQDILSTRGQSYAQDLLFGDVSDWNPLPFPLEELRALSASEQLQKLRSCHFSKDKA